MIRDLRLVHLGGGSQRGIDRPDRRLRSLVALAIPADIGAAAASRTPVPEARGGEIAISRSRSIASSSNRLRGKGPSARCISRGHQSVSTGRMSVSGALSISR